MFPWQTYYRGSTDTPPRSPLASTATCTCVRVVFIHMGRPGVIINGPFFQRYLVWMISSTGILPLTKWTIFNVHFKPCVQITGSADSPAAGLALWRGGMTSEYPGGTVVSEVTVLLTHWGRSRALHPAAGYTPQMRFLKTLSLNIKHLALDYKTKQTSGSFPLCLKSSLSSRLLHPTNVCRTLRDLLAEAGPLGPGPFLVRMGGTFLGRNKNNTAQYILISSCQTYRGSLAWTLLACLIELLKPFEFSVSI